MLGDDAVHEVQKLDPPAAPVMFDLATPLHKRSGDSPIQVYISLGQAF